MSWNLCLEIREKWLKRRKKIRGEGHLYSLHIEISQSFPMDKEKYRAKWRREGGEGMMSGKGGTFKI